MATALELTAGRLVVCLGPGGVGKTTLAAALALAAAVSGRSVDVMTVDPAPRLLDALGLRRQVAAPQQVPLAALKPRNGAELRALRLDPKRMFDRLIESHAPSAAARDAILGDRVYRALSAALAGVAHYMAGEQLLDLWRAAASELIVLDTPPAREAIDFLDAPRRMLELLSSRAVTLLGASRELARGPLGIFDLGARAVLAAFDRLSGLHLLADVRGFVQRLEGMYAGFAERATEVQGVLREPGTVLVLVSTAEPQRIEQTREFVSSLNRLGLRPGALIINRVMPALPAVEEIRRTRLPATLKRKLERNLADFGELKARESAWLQTLRALMPKEVPTLVAEELGAEPNTLKDLLRLARSLRIAC